MYETNSLYQAYYNLTNNMVLPEQSEGENSKALVTQIAANFASLGVRMKPEQMQYLINCSKEDLLSFYNAYYPVIEDRVGSRFARANLFYKGFPEQVLEKDRIDILFDQIVYGLSGFSLEPGKENYTFTEEDVTDTFPFLQDEVSHSVQCMKKDEVDQDINARFISLMSSLKPFTNNQYVFIKEYIKTFPKEITKLPIEWKNLPCHENRALIAIALNDHSKTKKLVPEVLQEAKDVLRYAAVATAVHGGVTDHSLLVQQAHLDNVNKFKLPRKDRQTCLATLNEIALKKNLTADIWNKKDTWKRFFRDVHPDEYKSKYPEIVKTAFDMRNNITPKRFSQELEESIKAKDLDKALALLESRPGELIRRADKLLRIAEEKGAVDKTISALKKALPEAGISTTIGLKAVLKERGTDETMRTVSYTRDGAQHVQNISNKVRTAFLPETMEKINDTMDQLLSPEGLSVRFKGKDLGKIYISPEMDYYTVPMDTRTLSEGMETFGRGSAIAMDTEHDIKRLFVHWTNMPDSRIDIDLSARLIGDSKSEFIAWNSAYYSYEQEKALDEVGAIYSGDIQDGGAPDGKGAAEYIDLNVPVLKEQGWKYVIANINSYCCQPFNEQPNTYFGWMERNREELGDHFEPSSVEERYKLTSHSTQETALLFDLKHDRVIWLDQQIKENVATRSAQDIEKLIDKVLGGALAITEIALANAIACEGQARTLEDADTIFITKKELEEITEKGIDLSDKKIVLPSDISYLTSELLIDGPDSPANIRKRERNMVKESSVLQHETRHKHREHEDLTR